MNARVRFFHRDTTRMNPSAKYAGAYHRYLDMFAHTMDTITGLSPEGKRPLSYGEYAALHNQRARPFSGKPVPAPHRTPQAPYLYDVYIREHGRQGRAHLSFADFAALHQAHGHIPQSYIDAERAYWAGVDSDVRRAATADARSYAALQSQKQAEEDAQWAVPAPRVPRHHS